MENQIDTAKLFLVSLTALVLIGVVFLIILTQFSQTSLMDYDETTSQSNFTYANPTQLESGQVFKSGSVQTYNNSWLSFDGVNDYVRNEDGITIVGNQTVSLWIKPYESGRNQQIFMNSPASESRFCVSLKSGLEVVGGFYNGSDTIAKKSSTPITLNTWNHIVYNFDGGTIGTMYLNGVLQSGSETVGTSTGGMIIGARGTTADYFNGIIDEVRIYNKSLSQSEITEIYSSGRIANSSLTSDGLVLWYSFNEASGTTLYDKIGGNNGTLTGF